ncbi:uncharacterized protein EI90DRAFT_3236010 [Cantharellus anzutake]|uniref:uncharacterized protein n=1 Tax=Cantharellus anzutake TaxID=1750568 RepID=UPI0019062C26|nr:uncharacterized protein EI90DRAFT_3236010 [Cantharellus anzutake]KAF8325394.1 hypothetical protein EI90DRAFT_3236010 [Cantharellus anzutake]
MLSHMLFVWAPEAVVDDKPRPRTFFIFYAAIFPFILSAARLPTSNENFHWRLTLSDGTTAPDLRTLPEYPLRHISIRNNILTRPEVQSMVLEVFQTCVWDTVVGSWGKCLWDTGKIRHPDRRNRGCALDSDGVRTRTGQQELKEKRGINHCAPYIVSATDVRQMNAIGEELPYRRTWAPS